MKAENQIVDALSRSQVYRDYENAFSETTGLPLAITPVETWQLPHHGHKGENPFCALMASKSRSCAACLTSQQELTEKARNDAATVTCPASLNDSAIPVKLGDRTVAFLHTGQSFRKTPTQAQFERTLKLVREWGVEASDDEVRDAYFKGRVVSPRQHDSIVTMLRIFAEHLSMVSNQLAVQQKNAEPPMIAKAKEFIRDHQEEDLSLGQVAKAVNCSPFYFCKMFRKVTGINFTDYVSRLRIERARNLLLNPNLRISEIAYEVGFQSLTHFNRVFKKLVGMSPTEYRGQLPAM